MLLWGGRRCSIRSTWSSLAWESRSWRFSSSIYRLILERRCGFVLSPLLKKIRFRIQLHLSLNDRWLCACRFWCRWLCSSYFWPRLFHRLLWLFRCWVNTCYSPWFWSPHPSSSQFACSTFILGMFPKIPLNLRRENDHPNSSQRYYTRICHINWQSFIRIRWENYNYILNREFQTFRECRWNFDIWHAVVEYVLIL